MEAAIPPDASAEERAALEQAVRAAEAVAVCLTEREQSSAGRVRPAYLAFQNGWGVFGDTLAVLSRLPADASTRGPRAVAMKAEVLPEGTAFALLDAGAAWNAGERRLKYIDDHAMGPQVAELVGADVLETVRRVTAGLREASGAGPVYQEAPSTTAVAEKLTDFSQLVGMYCRLLAAKVDERRPATVERFRRAIGPLEQYRASRRGQEESDDELLAPPAPPNGTPIAPGMPGSSPFMTGT